MQSETLYTRIKVRVTMQPIMCARTLGASAAAGDPPCGRVPRDTFAARVHVRMRVCSGVKKGKKKNKMNPNLMLESAGYRTRACCVVAWTLVH